MKDLEKILDAYCKYCIEGGLFESLGLDKCPCGCLCQNCELIPESPVLVRMQEIGRDMTEENVFNEFVEKYGKKEEDLRESSQASNTNDVSANS